MDLLMYFGRAFKICFFLSLVSCGKDQLVDLSEHEELTIKLQTEDYFVLYSRPLSLTKENSEVSVIVYSKEKFNNKVITYLWNLNDSKKLNAILQVSERDPNILLDDIFSSALPISQAEAEDRDAVNSALKSIVDSVPAF